MMTGGGSREGTSTAGRAARHIPVMLPEVMSALDPRDGRTYIDATFGAGGYSRAILEAAPGASVLALDRDPSVIAAARPICEELPNRLTVVEAPFSRLDEVARVYLSTDATDTVPSLFTPPAGIVLDIGVSSMQLEDPARGFSFMADGPLDMRMGSAGPTAADLVNNLQEAELAEVLWVYGEERRSRAIAKAIAARRSERPFERTRDLAELIERVLGRARGDEKHPATRSFQALRIRVNEELDELEAALVAAETVLVEGGRLVVVTFHSLEDRIVKSFLKERTGAMPANSRHLPGDAGPKRDATFHFVNRHPLVPSQEEVAGNPRSRSAKLRWALRTAAPAWARPRGAASLGYAPRLEQGRRRVKG